MFFREKILFLMACAVFSASSFTVNPSQSTTRSRSPTSTRMNSSSSSSHWNRRHFLANILVGSSVLLPPTLVQARGLVQFPCSELGNTYHFIRAGESLMEQDDIWMTNPLFLTNRDAALSEKGIQQVEETCQALKEQDGTPTIVMYSLAAAAMDTANIIGRELKVGRNMLVPEFTYLDPRGIGRFDSLSLASTQAAVWAMDNDEAGPDGRGARPPPNEDGTPNETLDNQCTRLRQLLSLMETQYSGDTVILVFPDGTGPALLSCMIAGIPYNRVHELNYSPGEIRLNVNMKTTKSLLKSGAVQPENYTEILAQGREELKRLRATRPEDIVSVTDQKLERDRLEMEAGALERAKKREAKDKRDEEAREARARDIERQKLLEQEAKASGDNGDSTPMMDSTTVVAGGAIGGSLAAAALFNGESDHDKKHDHANIVNATVASEADTGLEASDRSVVDILDIKEPVDAGDEDGDFLPSVVFPIGDSGENATETNWQLDDVQRDEMETSLSINSSGDDATEASRMRVNGDRHATFPPPKKQLDPVKAAEEAMKEYMELDDGGSEWLLMLSDLMLEEEDDKDEQHKLRP